MHGHRISSKLLFVEETSHRNRSQLFTERYLKSDGMFLLRQSSVALGDLPTAYMCRALYTSVLDPNHAPAYTLHSPSAASSTKSAKLYATLMRQKDA